MGCKRADSKAEASLSNLHKSEKEQSSELIQDFRPYSPQEFQKRRQIFSASTDSPPSPQLGSPSQSKASWSPISFCQQNQFLLMEVMRWTTMLDSYQTVIQIKKAMH